SGVVLGALYLLWMYQRVVFGPLTHDENRALGDLSTRELVVITPVIALCVVMGLYPAPFLARIEPSVRRILARLKPPTAVVLADRYALFFAVLVCVGAAFTVLMSIDYLRDNPLAGGDYYALVLLSTVGMILMAAANDLIVIFLALEIMSVAVYVLAGMLRTD